MNPDPPPVTGSPTDGSRDDHPGQPPADVTLPAVAPQAAAQRWTPPGGAYPGSWAGQQSVPAHTSPVVAPPQAAPRVGALPYPSGESPGTSRQGHSLPPYPVNRSAPPPEGPVTRTRPGRTWLIVISAISLALVAGFGGGTWATRTLGSSQVGTPPFPAVSSPTVSIDQSAAPGGSVQQVATAILPSVVSVLASSAGSAGEGSGVILSSDGLILTNNHVISGASTLQVHFFDGSTTRATVIGADVTDDLAVIKAGSASGLIPATLGTSRDLQVGQGVVAVGSPLGLSATVTSGIVSALNRPVRTSDQQQSPQAAQGQSTVLNAVQTDAAINPGNSGGPLVDMSAKVIGINSAIASLSSSATSQAGSIGVGFAIPIDQATRIAQEIIQTGTATHAVFGASVDDATTGGSTLLTSGATITQLTPGGPADAAGLQPNDVITKVGGQQVESADALIAAIRSASPNTAVDITYRRGTSSNTVTVTLGSATA